MDLHEYPRPANDTGIGVHWSLGFASTVGLGKIRDFWIPELKAMGVKWVKIFNHDGAMDFAELLLAEGIMPVVRIYRPSPNPSTLDIRELVHLDALVRLGVRYFEFNAEPDQDREWKGGRVPANGIDLVVENAIANMDTILERGGFPAVPAVSNGSRWDLVGKIVARGRKDLFNGPVWQAIHNYARNRPLDYPYDIGNQEGAAYTQRFYETIAAEQWGDDAWRGRTLQEVNRLRLERCNPGATIMDDNACWLAYEYFDARIRRHLGRSIPILATECGYIVGEDSDPRYPVTTPDLHMAQTLETCRVMMGVSTRFQNAPDYFFCTAFWLLGNAVLGSSAAWCEHHAWYSDRRPGGVLPIVRALRAEPKSARRWQGVVALDARGMVHGTVINAGERRTILLTRGGNEVARAELDANSRYVLGDLVPGNYTLRVAGTTVEQPVSLAPGQPHVTVNFDLTESTPFSGSTLSGRVRGGASAVVLLLRTSDGEEWVTMAKDDGTFRFVDLPPGAYNVRVQGEGSHVAGILLDGHNQREVELAVAGWGHTIRTLNAPGGLIRCTVEGASGVMVTARRAGWFSAPVPLLPEATDSTGQAQASGEISGLEPGDYELEVDGLPDLDGRAHKAVVHVTVTRTAVPQVHFVFTALEQLAGDLHNSTIRGRVIGGCTPTRRLVVWLTDDQANRREVEVGPDCTFRFEGLPPGLYSVEIVGAGEPTGRSDIALDGKNTVSIELVVMPEESFTPDGTARTGRSVITGSVPEGAGKLARLTDAVGNEQRQIVDPNDAFLFDELPPGVYSVSVEGGYAQPGLTVDGANGLLVTFQPLSAAWEAKVSPAGSMPGYSVVRVEVEGMRNLPVYLWKEDWEGMTRRTGTKPEYGDCVAEFSPLGPGHYMVEPEGLGLWADVELTGLEVVWIDFRRKVLPSRPNTVTTLDPAEVAALPPRPSTPPPAWEGDDYAGFAQEEFTADEFAQDDFAPGTPAGFAAEDARNTWMRDDDDLRGVFSPAAAPGMDDRADETTQSAAPEEQPERDDGWLRSRTVADDFAFSFPALTSAEEDDDARDGASNDAGKDEAGDEVDYEADDQVWTGHASARLTQATDTEDDDGSGARRANPATRPLCLLIPQPVTDLDEMAALLRFVAKARPVVARRVEEVPAGSHVLLIGVTGQEDWRASERALMAQGNSYERVTRRLVELFGDPNDPDLY